MYKKRKKVGGIVAQLVVAQLVCRRVDWRPDIFMSEISDIYLTLYFRCKYIYNRSKSSTYIVPILLCSDRSHRCKKVRKFFKHCENVNDVENKNGIKRHNLQSPQYLLIIIISLIIFSVFHNTNTRG